LRHSGFGSEKTVLHFVSEHGRVEATVFLFVSVSVDTKAEL